MNPDSSTPSTQIEVSSFLTRATNVFMAPSEVYAEVATAPVQRSSWLTPYLLTLLISVIFTMVLFSNPSLRGQMFEAQQETWKEKIESGEMTEADAEKAREFMESSSIVTVIGVVSSAVVASAMIFVAALGLWLVMKFILKSKLAYGKMLELYGLASLIGVVGAIVTLMLINVLDTIHVSPGGALLLLGSFDKSNFVHKLLAAITVFGVWQTAVIGIGIAKISGSPTSKGMSIAFALWAILVVFFATTGLGIM